MDTSNCFYEGPLYDPGHRIALHHVRTFQAPGGSLGRKRNTRPSRGSKSPPIGTFRQVACIEGKALTQATQGIKMAERVGFEPTVRFPVRSLSRRVLSTAQSPLRGRWNFNRSKGFGFEQSTF